jgi:hypothetical protein
MNSTNMYAHIASKKQRVSVPLSDDEDQDDSGAASIKSRISRFRKSPVKGGNGKGEPSHPIRLTAALTTSQLALKHQMTTTSSSLTHTIPQVRRSPVLRRVLLVGTYLSSLQTCLMKRSFPRRPRRQRRLRRPDRLRSLWPMVPEGATTPS